MKAHHKEPDYGWPAYSDFYITFVAGLISMAVNKVFNAVTWNFFYAYCKEKKDEEVRLAKTKKACNSFYKVCYFTFATSWGYYILKDEPYLPPELLGHGDIEKVNETYPTPPWPAGFRLYYLGTMGYHVHQLLSHALEDVRNDFVEMFLHHIVTLLLYGFSYLTMMTAGGAMIMYLHDWADIFAGVVRCFTETTILPMTLFGITGMATSWAYTRLYVFPNVIWVSCFKYHIYGPDHDFFAVKYFGILLSVLAVLHFHWFVIIIKSIHRYAFKGKADDLQQRVIRKDEKDD